MARPILPLAACALLCSAGMLVMATAGSLAMAIAGYVVFAIAAAIFLSLHASQTLRVLPAPEHRGRDLGLFNLTNTFAGDGDAMADGAACARLRLCRAVRVVRSAVIGERGSARLFRPPYAKSGYLNAWRLQKRTVIVIS